MNLQQPKIENGMNEKLTSEDILGIYYSINTNNNLDKEVINKLNYYLVNARFRILKKALKKLSYNSDGIAFLGSQAVYRHFVGVIYNIALATNDSHAVDKIAKKLGDLVSLISVKEIDSLNRYQIFFSICQGYVTLYEKLEKGYIKEQYFTKFNLELTRYYYNAINSLGIIDESSNDNIRTLVKVSYGYNEIKQAECV